LNISLAFTTCELVGEPGYPEQNCAYGVHERLGHRGLEVHAAVRHPPSQGQPGRRLLQVTFNQSCGSGMFIPDPGFFIHPGSWIQQVWTGKEIFFSQNSKNYNTFTQKFVFMLSKIWQWGPGSGKKHIPDPGSRVKKAPDPGSATLPSTRTKPCPDLFPVSLCTVCTLGS
jgi:hypothetical protein